MWRDDLGDLKAFVTVAEERGFTRAAARLGTTQSALSHTMRRLETRLGVRLLDRTTRSVAPTAAGEFLLASLVPTFEGIDDLLAALGDLQGRPAGRFRITAGEHAVETVLWPKLAPLLRAHPDIRIELDVDAALRDIVAERYDAGVRLGEQVEKDMIAVPIAPPARMIVTGAPSLLADRPPPRVPQDLTRLPCINLRLPTLGGFYVWEFEKEGRSIRVRVEGQWAFNTAAPTIAAAVEGAGFCFLPEDMTREHRAAGRLVSVLDDWCPSFPGYHLYYPSRRRSSAAFTLIVETLRHRG